ncbi:hypothetical protein QJS10_CPB14g00379 [Acorus calamus]|uniref:RCHY1 zinc-ribbon domain-containing protein n=1 Tax=Acorus calamus TaxID=4465 RepID=A0AAV9D9I3_ACOCL|nr:hypothetical protein QJS10_CPB14g00379 [Acorus calamus]
MLPCLRYLSGPRLPVHHRIPRHQVPLRHPHKQRYRFLHFPDCGVLGDHRIPAHSVSVRHSIERLLSLGNQAELQGAGVGLLAVADETEVGAGFGEEGVSEVVGRDRSGEHLMVVEIEGLVRVVGPDEGSDDGVTDEGVGGVEAREHRDNTVYDEGGGGGGAEFRCKSPSIWPFHAFCLLSGIYTCSHYACPICSKSLGDMAVYFGMLDAQLATEVLPEEYRDCCQDILFNNCEKKGIARFHWLYNKCGSCGSYNTLVIKTHTPRSDCSRSE